MIFGSKNFDSMTFFYFFALFFFGIAPLVQYVQGLNLSPMYDEELQEIHFLRLNVVLMCIFVVFEISYRCLTRGRASVDVKSHDFELRNFLLPLVFVFCALFVFLWFQKFNLLNVLIRGGDSDGERNNEVKMVGLLCGQCLRYIPISVATLYWMYGNGRVLKFLYIAVGVFCCFPLGMPRLQVAPAYLPLMIVMFRSLYKRRMLLVSLFVGAILFLFPLLHGFREKDVDLSGFDLFDFSFLNQLHFDSYASFAYILKERFSTGGEQLMGVLFFWVPRALWADKPIESGRMIAETFDLGMGDFTNIAINYFAEGYLNFGLVGVLLFAFVIAYVCARLDKSFWSDARNLSKPAVVYYFSWLGILVFLLRGDLMAGFSYTIGIMMAHKISEIVVLRKVT